MKFRSWKNSLSSRIKNWLDRCKDSRYLFAVRLRLHHKYKLKNIQLWKRKKDVMPICYM